MTEPMTDRIDLTTPLARLLLPMADDELVTGHRTSHWTGVAPALEEDLAFATISQDEVNHADVFYGLLVADQLGHDLSDDDASALRDRLGLGRAPGEYRHAVLCERPPGDFTWTLARHWAYDHFDAVRVDALTDSTHADVAGVATKLQHEERYHLLHADRWFDRLARDEARGRDELAAALADLLPEALWLFEPLEGEDDLLERGLMPRPSHELRERWLDGVTSALEAVELSHVLPDDLRPAYDLPGGRRGVHTPDFDDDVWPEMTHLHRAHPGATW